MKLSFPGEVIHLDRWRSYPLKLPAFHRGTFPRPTFQTGRFPGETDVSPVKLPGEEFGLKGVLDGHRDFGNGTGQKNTPDTPSDAFVVIYGHLHHKISFAYNLQLQIRTSLAIL